MDNTAKDSSFTLVSNILRGPEAKGAGIVVVLRRRGARRIECASFLVDPYCKGVLDAWSEVIDDNRLKTIKEEYLDGDYFEENGAWGPNTCAKP